MRNERRRKSIVEFLSEEVGERDREAQKEMHRKENLTTPCCAGFWSQGPLTDDTNHGVLHGVVRKDNETGCLRHSRKSVSSADGSDARVERVAKAAVASARTGASWTSEPPAGDARLVREDGQRVDGPDRGSKSSVEAETVTEDADFRTALLR